MARRRRTIIIAAALVLSLMLLGVVPKIVHYFKESQVTDELDSFLAHLDATEPGWRLADLEARRAPVPDEENRASIVLAASKLLPEKWPPEEFTDMQRRLDEGDEEWLHKEDIPVISDELRQHSDALAEAHRLVTFPGGRFPSVIYEGG